MSCCTNRPVDVKAIMAAQSCKTASPGCPSGDPMNVLLFSLERREFASPESAVIAVTRAAAAARSMRPVDRVISPVTFRTGLAFPEVLRSHAEFAIRHGVPESPDAADHAPAGREPMAEGVAPRS